MAVVADTVDVKELKTRVKTLEEEVSNLKRQFEKLEIQAAIRKGKDAAERGMVIPARELVASLRAKYNLPTP